MNKLVFIVIALLFIIICCFFSTVQWSGYARLSEGMVVERQEAVIPLDIYQTWHTKDLPPKMSECVEKLKKQNPEFKHHLFDENDCKEFIKNNFDNDVVEAFDALVPLAYKSDLWRYCVMYKKGGIYLDIKFEPKNNFKLLELVDKEYFVLERPYIQNQPITLQDELNQINAPDYYDKIKSRIDANFWKDGQLGVCNGMIICKQNNAILLECIQEIVKNVKNKYYGNNALHPTGPVLLGEKYFKGDMNKIRDMQLFHSVKGNLIITRNKEIFEQYTEYRAEQKTHGKSHAYYDLWDNKQIYK